MDTEDYSPPFCEKLPEDKNLKLTLANNELQPHGGIEHQDQVDFLRIALEDMVGKVRIPVTYDMNSATTFPGLHTVAVLAMNAYKNKEKNMTFQDGWKLVATAVNRSMVNGYFGAAFLNAKLHQIVIAHRGTKPLKRGSLWTDAIGILFNEMPKQMKSACTFSKKVGLAAKEVENKLGLRFQFIFTGHSLGAWLAQITTFALEYLEIVDSKFQKAVQERGRSESIHAHTVVFDSPGCKPMLSQMKDKFDIRYSGRSIDINQLDITTYLSAPNMVNTCNAHAGTLYRLKMDFPKMTPFKEIFMLIYTKEVHAMDGIVEALKKILSNPALEPELVTDWPILSVGKYLSKPIVEVLPIFSNPIDTIINIFWKKNSISPENDELANFLKLASHSNKYHIDLNAAKPRAEIERKHGYWSIRYQTKHADITRCKINVFSLKEQKFLTRYHTLRTFPGQLQCSEIFEMVQECKRKEIKSSLKTFEIKDGYIEHGNLKRFIPYVQQLLHWHEEIHEATKDKMSPYVIKKTVYDNETEQFLNSIKRSEPEYMDTKLKNCWGSKVCHVIVKQEKEMRAITKQIYHLHAHNADNQLHCTVLNLKKLLQIDEKSVRLKDFVASKEMNSHSFLVECKNAEHKYDEARTMFRSILDELNKKIEVRFIFITIEGDRLSQYLQQEYKACMGDVFRTIKHVGTNWKDLAKESQKVLSEKQLICLNGENAKISLSDLVKSTEDIAEIIDLTTLGKLIQNEEITVGKESWSLHNTQTASVALYDQVNKDQLVQTIRQSDGNPFFQISFSTNITNRDELLKDLNLDNLKEKVHIPNEMDMESNETEWVKLCSRHREKLLYWCEFATSDTIYCKGIYDPQFHIKRQIGVDMNRVMKKSDDLYIISYHTLDEKAISTIKRDYKTMVLTEEKAEKYFERLRKFAKSVHWYKADQNQKLTWYDPAGLYILTDAVKISGLYEERLANVQERVIIIAGEPGMGKSTTLMHLAELLKEHWVIMRSLRFCEQEFKDLNDMITEDAAVEFLSNGKNGGLSSGFAKALLKRGLQGKTNKKLYLLFDGFDEIKDTVLEKNTVKLILFPKKHCKCHVWITTRKNCTDELEKFLSTTAVNLEEIKSEERGKFMAAIWKNELSLQTNEIHLEILRAYAKKILDKAAQVLGYEETGFLSSPLQLRMIAEAFLLDAETIEMLRIKDVGVEVNANASLLVYQTFVEGKYDEYLKDKTSLYQTFIKRKYDIYLEDKAGLISNACEAPKQWCTEYLAKKHKILAFRLLYPNEASQHFCNYNGEEAEKDIKDMNHVGLIQSKCSDLQYDFIHGSIVDFFVAKLLERWLKKPKGRHERLSKLLISPITTEQRSKGVRFFLDEILKKNTAIKEYLINLCPLYIKEMCQPKDDPNLKNCCPILYVAAKEKLETVIEMLFVCFEHHAEALMKLISWRNQDGKTALYTAMEKGNKAIVKQFLDFIQECPKTTQQELLYSTCYRTSEDNENPVISKLMEKLESSEMKQISDSIKKQWGNISIFMKAAGHGDITTIRKLFPEDSEYGDAVFQKYLIAARNNIGKTALHFAAMNGHEDIVTYLLRKGANANAKDHYGKTPCDVAKINGHVNVVECLQVNFQNTCDGTLETANKESLVISKTELDMMVDQFCSETMPISGLLDQFGLDKIEEFKRHVNSYRDNNNSTPLHITSMNGNAGAVRWLITDGLLDYNDINNRGLTPLHIAANRGHREVINVLKRLGASLKCKDKEGNTALHIAARVGNADIVEQLLKFRADANAKGQLGNTPLHVAVQKGYEEVVRCLIANGAEVIIRNQSDETPLDMANNKLRQFMWEHHLDKMVNEFCTGREKTTAKREKTITELLEIVGEGNIEEFKRHVNSYEGKNNSTPLHIASMHGNVEAVKWLSENGLDLNAEDNWGLTPLHIAAKRNHKDVVQVLVKYGANLECKDKKGKTASQLTTNQDIQKLLHNEAADIAKNEQSNQVANSRPNQANQTSENSHVPDDVDAEILAEIAESNLENLEKWKLVKKMIKQGVNVKNLSADHKNDLLNYVTGNNQTENNDFDLNIDSIGKVIALNNVDILDYMIYKMRERSKNKQAVNADCKFYEINLETQNLSNTMLQRFDEEPFCKVKTCKNKNECKNIITIVYYLYLI